MKLRSIHTKMFGTGLLCIGLFGFVWMQMDFRIERPGERVLTNSLGQPKSLDPALASDYASCVAVLSLYDTLFQYDYLSRPYKAIPSMLKEYPKISADGTVWNFELREDLKFSPDPCFVNDSERIVTSDDVLFSLRRLADARVLSSGYWILRGKIKGLDAWREMTLHAAETDTALFDLSCEGFEKIDSRRFRLHLNAPEPRLPCLLAMAYAAVVSRKATETYGSKLSEHPVGSGPFTLANYQRDYRMEFQRNPEYRYQTFPQAENPADSVRSLPLADRIICYLVQDPQPGWLMFLNGDLDMSTVDKDHMDAVGPGGTLPPALARRGIRLLTAPELLIYYIGFSYSDPRLANNLHLRRAISLAYDIELRRTYYNGLIMRAEGPIPPGIAGTLTEKNPWTSHNLDSARKEMILAGFPEGIDPKIGENLRLSFDLPETGPSGRQLAEMMVRDMAKIGIVIDPQLNSKPKFLEKNRAGQMQLFRFNWIGDYPDAENFFQLFYSPNAGSCNRTFYHDAHFDSCYETAVRMPDSLERTRRYEEMSRYLTDQCPWIFESHPLSYRLLHGWVENYHDHDFGFDRWKYLSLDPEKRIKTKSNFTPLPIGFAEPDTP